MEELVDKVKMPLSVHYRDYTNKDKDAKHKYHSFYTLLLANNFFWDNPLGEHYPVITDDVMDNFEVEEILEMSFNWQEKEVNKITGKLIILLKANSENVR